MDMKKPNDLNNKNTHDELPAKIKSTADHREEQQFLVENSMSFDELIAELDRMVEIDEEEQS
jgi:hypothetical protein